MPADGVVVDGTSSLDLSLLTGESRPVEVAAGSPVHAGTVNLSGRLVVEVRATGEDTRVGRLMLLIEDAARRRAPVVRLADRLSAWFVVAVLGLAAVTLLVWLRLDPAHAVDHAVALLIVSCPCALGLATPLAVAAAIGRAARAGILIKGGDALEQLARSGRMILDKTGTLTEGRLSVVQWHGDDEAPPRGRGDRGLLLPPGGTGARGPRPAITASRVGDVTAHPGLGMTATGDGRRLLVGSPAFATACGIARFRDAGWPRSTTTVAAGLTPVVVAWTERWPRSPPSVTRSAPTLQRPSTGSAPWVGPSRCCPATTPARSPR